MRRLVLGVLSLCLFIGPAALANTPDEDKKPEAAKADVKKTEDKKPEEKKADAKKTDTSKPIIAVFRLDVDITEKPGQEDFLFGGLHQVSFRELVSRMKKAGEDPNVKAVVLMSESNAFGLAQIEELRQVLGQVRAAGKDIYAHLDSVSLGQYILLSGVTRLSVVPTADLWITGLHGEAMYLRGLFDMLGIVPDFLTCGAYKSAAEMFMRKGPSPEADKMQNWLLDSSFETIQDLIARGRGVDKAKVKSWIDNGPYIAAKAKTLGLVDAVEAREEFNDLLKKKYGKDITFNRKYGEKKGPDLDLSSPFAFLKIWGDMLGEAQKKKPTKATIGVVYVEGGISLGTGQSSPFGGASGAHSTDIRKALDEAARDENIKAVVLRVDSPGGSAVASDIILDATKRVKAKKPFVVSMGNVAGSGGYYVACGSDLIFADEATITGSIGVVSGKLVTNPMWNKIGVNFKEYNRGQNAAMLSSSSPFSKEEKERMQGWMDEIYDVFKNHVKAIRGSRLKKPIDELAGGRVYTGRQALELGLVDKIGTLQDAIAYVADEAKLKDYDVRAVPAPKNFLEVLLEENKGGKDDPKNLDARVRLPQLGNQIDVLKLAMPHLEGLEPARARMLKNALQQLQTLQREGVTLMMPEIRLLP